MSKIFLDHLILREELDFQLNKFSLDPEEKEELRGLIDEILHHHALNVILNHLPQEHHSEFTRRLLAAPHDDQLLVFVKEKISIDIETAIRDQSKKVKQEILKDIRRCSKRR